MSTQVIITPYGIDPDVLRTPQALRIHDYQTSDEGLTTAVVEYVCHPPDPSKYPKKDSKHPQFPDLLLESIEVSQSGFTFLRATYVGIIWPKPGLPSPVIEQDTQVIDAGIRFVLVGENLVLTTSRIKRVTNRERGVSKLVPTAPATGTVSWVKRGKIYLYTKETLTPDEVIPFEEAP